MDLEAVRMFVDVPVSLQLKGPLGNHGSLERVVLGDEGEECGRAALLQDKGGQVQPITVWAGTIHSVCEVGLVFDSLGHGGVPLRVFVPYDMVAGLFFAIRHVEIPEPPRIVQ